MSHSIEYFFFWLILKWVSIVPESWVTPMGKWFGLLAYFLGIRKLVIQTNLKIAFGSEKTEEELKELRKNFYIHLGITAFKFLWMDSIAPEDLPRYLTLDGIDILEEALREGNGVVNTTGHSGNWELIGAGIAHYASKPLEGYVDKQVNGIFDKKSTSSAKNSGRERFQNPA